ncbi:MAG: DUF2752 domain-containing protein [Prolixibacteraceae bacterium]|nr:DUF2752 domain-containing protein [Prolixibacteraceae bacterium]
MACVAGYIWLYIGLSIHQSGIKTVEVCPIKHLTNIPCPSCGSTRAVILLTKGEFVKALLLNPLGYVVAVIMMLTPFWILADLVTQKETLYKCYQKTEMHLRKPGVAIPLILFVIVNWIWNITKGL